MKQALVLEHYNVVHLVLGDDQVGVPFWKISPLLPMSGDPSKTNKTRFFLKIF